MSLERQGYEGNKHKMQAECPLRKRPPWLVPPSIARISSIRLHPSWALPTPLHPYIPPEVKLGYKG